MQNLNLNYNFSVAPMMGVTTSSARYMYRLISSEAILFTEMIASQALYRGDHEKLLKKQSLESPGVLQVGGSNSDLLKYSTNLANQYSYQGINLNVGCPSKKVSQGKMGACLMKEARLVKECVSSKIKESSITVPGVTTLTTSLSIKPLVVDGSPTCSHIATLLPALINLAK